MESESRQTAEDSSSDSPAIRDVINKVKSQGLFDQFRKECLADVDTKPAYHNLIQRVEKFVERFLNGQKWNANVNKNQLRETLRRQLNNSGVMTIGVDRIIDQVVNPKILLGIKPRIDEAVSNHLGIDLKARQEEQQKRKQEQQRLMLQQQQLQSLMNQNMKPDDAFGSVPGILPTPGALPWSQPQTGATFPAPTMPGMANSVAGAAGITSSVSGVPFNPQGMGFGGMMQPFFMGGWTPGLSGMESFNQTMQPMIPGQPMIPSQPMIPPFGGITPAGASVTPFNNSTSPSLANTPSVSSQPTPAQSVPDFSKPPPGLPGTPLLTNASNIGSSPGIPGMPLQSSPVAPPGILGGSVGAIIRPPPPGSIPPPPGTVPVIPPVSLVPPPASVRPALPTTPTIPALISHTLSKVSKEDLTPEKIAVFKTAAAFITKTVSNAQATPGADLASMFSPRVLAEAMMAESGKPLTKHEIRAAKRKERMKEFERLKAEREKEEEEKRRALEMKSEGREDPLPPNHNLMDVFQAAEDVSDDEETFDMIDAEESERNLKQGVTLYNDSKGEEQAPTSQPGKKYNFAWDVDRDPGELSDVTVSSVHTSDLSSFEDLSLNSEEDTTEPSEDNVTSKGEINLIKEHSEVIPEKDKPQGDDNQDSECPALSEKENDFETVAAAEGVERDKPETVNIFESQFAADVVPLIPPISSASITRTSKSEASKPRKLIALSYKYSDSEDDESREERKARIAREKEERYQKRLQRRAEMEAKRKEREEERARIKEEKKKQKELQKSESQEQSKSEEAAEMRISEGQDSNINSEELDTSARSPRSANRKRKNKAEMKEQLHQQKVMERKAALRRQRTRNRRYASEEFTSIFSEHKTLSQSYTESTLGSEEIVTFDSNMEIVEMTIDEECIVETVGEEVETVEVTEKDLMLPFRSPYSDISDRSMSDKSEDEQKAVVEMEEVSSDEDITTSEKPIDDEAVKTSSSMHESDTDDSQSQNHSITSSVEGMSLSSQSKPVTNLSEDNSVKEEEIRGSSRATMSSPSDNDDKASQLSSKTVDKQPLQSDGMVEISKENQEESTAEEGETASPKDPMVFMGDLELEPVSDEDSPLDNLSASDSSDEDKEEGEEKDSDVEEEKPSQVLKTDAAASTKASEDVSKDDEASDEGEIKSDSDESAKAAEDKERTAHRTPIELVDFGEAEKRARVSRSYYPDPQQERGRSMRGMTVSNFPPSAYRGTYSPWTQPDVSLHSQYASSIRYSVSHEGLSSSRVKSPMAASYDGGESETSSHSRSSVRLRDDVPPPYPIEGVTRKHRSPASDQGSSSVYKALSLPSPVSSASSSRSRSSSSDSSQSRSRSGSESRSSSSSSSSSSRSSQQRKMHSERDRRNKRKDEDTEEKTASQRSQVPSSKLSGPEGSISPVKFPEQVPSVSQRSHSRERHLSSGHESISSDELPDFPDEEPPQPLQTKKRSKSPGDLSSSSSTSSRSHQSKRKKKGQRKGRESISSSELIYSPSRLKSPGNVSETAKDSNAEDDDDMSIERPPMSPGRSSISSGELPDYPGEDPDPSLLQEFSPHQPPLPSDLPPLPEDTDGFQPPLPQDSPPLPRDSLPPPPPMEDDEKDSEIPPLPLEEMEDGEIEDDVEPSMVNLAREITQELMKKSPVKSFNLPLQESKAPSDIEIMFPSESAQVSAQHSDTSISLPSPPQHALQLSSSEHVTLSCTNSRAAREQLPSEVSNNLKYLEENGSCKNSKSIDHTFSERYKTQEGIKQDELQCSSPVHAYESEPKCDPELSAFSLKTCKTAAESAVSYDPNISEQLNPSSINMCMNEGTIYKETALVSSPNRTIEDTPSVISLSSSDIAVEKTRDMLQSSSVGNATTFVQELSSGIAMEETAVVMPQPRSVMLLGGSQTVNFVQQSSSDVTVDNTADVTHSCMTLEDTNVAIQSDSDVKVEKPTNILQSDAGKSVDDIIVATPKSYSDMAVKDITCNVYQLCSDVTVEKAADVISQSCLDCTATSLVKDDIIHQSSSDSKVEGTEAFISQSSLDLTVKDTEKIFVHQPNSEIAAEAATAPQSSTVLKESGTEKIIGGTKTIDILQSSSNVATEIPLVQQSSSQISVNEAGNVLQSNSEVEVGIETCVVSKSSSDMFVVDTERASYFSEASSSTDVSETGSGHSLPIEQPAGLIMSEKQEQSEIREQSKFSDTDCLLRCDTTSEDLHTLKSHPCEVADKQKEGLIVEGTDTLEHFRTPKEKVSLAPVTPEPPHLLQESISSQKISSPQKGEGLCSLDPPSLTRQEGGSPLVPFIGLSAQEQAVTPEPPRIVLQPLILNVDCEQNENYTSYEEINSRGDPSALQVTASLSSIESSVSSCSADSSATADMPLTSADAYPPPLSTLNSLSEQTSNGTEVIASHMISHAVVENIPSTKSDSSELSSSKEALPNIENQLSLYSQKQVINTPSSADHNTMKPKCVEPVTSSSALMSDTVSEAHLELPDSGTLAPVPELKAAPVQSPGQRSLSSEDACEATSVGPMTKKRKCLAEDSGNSSDTSAASNESVPKRRRRGNQSIVDDISSTAMSRPGTRLQQHQRQELSRPLTRGKSSSLPSNRDTRSKKEAEKSPPIKKQKR